VHWADEATLDLLKFAAVASRKRAAFSSSRTATMRSIPITGYTSFSASCRAAHFGGFNFLLSEAAVAELARRAGRAHAGLRALTGGNPFFVTEILAASGDAVPISIRDAVLARASRLSAEARHLLDMASVVPGRTERWLLERLADKDNCAGRVHQCGDACAQRDRGHFPARAGAARMGEHARARGSGRIASESAGCAAGACREYDRRSSSRAPCGARWRG
jgi:hypothetical protein